MSDKSSHIKKNIYEYILSVSHKENDILKSLREETYKLNIPSKKMHISPEQGQFMQVLTSLIKAEKVIEIGVFTGYSSISMAKGMPENSKLIACDTNENYTKIAQKYWKIAKVEHKIELKLAPALETLNSLIKTNWLSNTDLIFIDADKINYTNYYNLSLKLLKKGGLILIDNTLWGGKVTETENADTQTKAIQNLNNLLKNSNDIELNIIPIGDGLTIARKK